MAQVGASPGSPIHIVVLKRTQQEFDQHPSSLKDSWTPHPDRVPDPPNDMTIYKHPGRDSDDGSEQWELDNLKDASGRVIGKQVNKGNINLGQLQLWIRNSKGTYVLLKAYPIQDYGGPLGPKVRQGDFQTPEGFYKVTDLKPGELVDAIGLDFPNTYDRKHRRAGVSNLGGNILIHGENVTVGCLAMGNDIKEIYSIVAATKRANPSSEIGVDIYPFPLTDANLAKVPPPPPGVSFDFKAFWKKMQPGYLAFQQTHLPPTITYDQNGDYIVQDHLPQGGPYDLVTHGFGLAPYCTTCTTPPR
jgi:hypothetical protein